MADVKADLSGAKKFLKLLKGCPDVKVGIVGNEASAKHNKSDGKLTNAQVGFIQEYGKKTPPKIEARSFIRMPLEMYLGDYLKKKKTFQEKEIKKALESGKYRELSKKLGLVAEEVIDDAFATRGFGHWAPNRPSTIAKKGSDSPLIDTGQLRRSISSEVMDDKKRS